MTFNDLKNWFLHSETILWGRIQMLIGAIWVTLVATDLSSVIPSKYFTVWLIFSGVVTEILRRRGSEAVTTTVAAAPFAVDQTPVVMKMLSDVPAPGT